MPLHFRVGETMIEFVRSRNGVAEYRAYLPTTKMGPQARLLGRYRATMFTVNWNEQKPSDRIHEVIRRSIDDVIEIAA